MSSAHTKTGAVGILGLQAGEDVNKSLDDLGPLTGLPAPAGDAVATQIMRIPAPLLCDWMGATEIAPDEDRD